jgi:hypothetical protein
MYLLAMLLILGPTTTFRSEETVDVLELNNYGYATQCVAWVLAEDEKRFRVAGWTMAYDCPVRNGDYFKVHWGKDGLTVRAKHLRETVTGFDVEAADKRKFGINYRNGRLKP